MTQGSEHGFGAESGVRTLPASLGQRLLWIVDRYRGGDGAINCPVVFRMRGALREDVLQLALDSLVARHEALRTVVQGRGAMLLQRVHLPRPVSIAHVDVSGTECPQESTELALTRELRTRVDATTWPMRTTLIRTGPEDHLLCLNISHFVTDAWSCAVLFQDLRLLFERASGRKVDLPPMGWQYAEFCQHQSEQRQSNAWQHHHSYWSRQLARASLPNVPFGPQRSESAQRVSGLCGRPIGETTVARLREVARTERSTLFAVTLAIANVLLHATTRRNDLTIASLFANRGHSQARSTIGFIANMVLLRTRLPEPATFLDVLRETHRTATDAFVHQELPYQLLPLDAIESQGRRPDDVAFQMMADPIPRTTMTDLDVDVLVPEGIGSRMELELVLVPREGFRALAFFNRGRLTETWVEAFLGAYCELAERIAGAPTLSLAALRNSPSARNLARITESLRSETSGPTSQQGSRT